MLISRFDHIVLCVRDVPATLKFYTDTLSMDAREERPGKWSLHFGNSKISIQDAENSPTIARDTTPGSGNFCVLTETPISDVMETLNQQNVEIVDGPGERAGATGQILSVYFNDPEGNLVEVSNQL